MCSSSNNSRPLCSQQLEQYSCRTCCSNLYFAVLPAFSQWIQTGVKRALTFVLTPENVKINFLPVFIFVREKLGHATETWKAIETYCFQSFFPLKFCPNHPNKCFTIMKAFTSHSSIMTWKKEKNIVRLPIYHSL